jgi:hypothetical protein
VKHVEGPETWSRLCGMPDNLATVTLCWCQRMQEEGRPDAAVLASEGVQDSGADVEDLMAQLQSLGQ